MKKILLIGSSAKGALEYSYMKAARNLSLEPMLFDPVAESNDKYVKGGRIGRKLHLFLPIETWTRKMNRDLVLLIRDFAPEIIVLFTNTPVFPGTLAYIKTMLPGTKLVWIWPDPLLSLEKHNLMNAPLIDLAATYSNATIPVLHQLGFKKVIWVPLAGDPLMHGKELKEDQQFTCDIAFVGTWRPERERVMTVLCKHFIDYKIEIYGRYWLRECKDSAIRKSVKGNGLFESAMAEKFRQTKVNINVIDDTNFPAVNMRFFEIPTTGGLEVTSPGPEMEKQFRHREHLLYYQNDEDVITQVKWALEHPEECAAIRRNGYRLVNSQHTYEHRLQQILEVLNESE